MVEIKEPNTCVRGCCSSTSIPLHLQPSCYTLLSPIAKGSESAVYEAILHDNAGGESRRVAAKKPILSTSDDLDKFHRQLQLLCRLDHPGLAKLVAAQARPPNYIFFFELYQSRSLADKIHVEEWIPDVEEVLLIATRIAEALQYLHGLGVVHRDVKPANILLDKGLVPRLADFGLATYAKDLEPTSVTNWKSTGKPTGGFHKKNMVGTLIYMAPEILKKECYTEKSDIYSFAVTINELLTGVVPYTDLRAEAQAHTVLEMNYTEQQLTSKIVAEGLRPILANVESGFPPTLLSLIERCWDPNPQLRPSFDNIIQDLKSIKVCTKDKEKVKLSYTEGCQIQSFQEDLNWSTQGERVSFEMASNDDRNLKIWPNIPQNHPIYLPKLSWGSFATCGRRETMEDTHFLLPQFCSEKDVHAFGIFDGHRGAAAAEFSARALPGFLRASGFSKSPAAALTEAFLKTDIAFRRELICQYDAKRIPQKNWHPGCTAVAALIVRDMIFVANAGDCRAILCRSGHAFPLTMDHVASCPSERERIIQEGLEVKWQVDTWRVGAVALQVTRSIGDDDLKPAVTAEPEITEVSLSFDDEYMVMASDGLWDVVSNDDVVSIVRDTVKEPGMCSKRLATEAAARGGKDNITVIVVFLRPVSTAERIY